MAANMIDYVLRYNPSSPTTQPIPADALEAKAELERGNKQFSDWVEGCRTGTKSPDDARYVRDCSYLGEVMGWDSSGLPRHSPFAIVVGCSDARVPVEMVLGQGPNELFVVRVAGNVLDTVGQGSIDYAVTNLAEDLRTIVVLGHVRCGAVIGAVDAYLQPELYRSFETTAGLRSILRRIFVSVRSAANALRERHGTGVESWSGFRDALIRTTVNLNAAQSAYDLRQEVQRSGREIPVLYGVYNLHNGCVGMPAEPDGLPSPETQGLVPAPFSAREFGDLATRVVRSLDPELLRGGDFDRHRQSVTTA